MATGPAEIVAKHFVNVTDPRAERGLDHDLIEWIFLASTATLCGARCWLDVERFVRSKLPCFHQFVALERGVPSRDTFGRVFYRLDAGEFLSAMFAWGDEFAGDLRGRGIAVDGKTLRGSFDRAAGKSPLHPVRLLRPIRDVPAATGGRRRKQ